MTSDRKAKLWALAERVGGWLVTAVGITNVLTLCLGYEWLKVTLWEWLSGSAGLAP